LLVPLTSPCIQTAQYNTLVGLTTSAGDPNMPMIVYKDFPLITIRMRLKWEVMEKEGHA